MLRLGIDIDGTITAQDTFVPYLNRSFNLSISLNDMTDYDLTKLLNITQEEFWDWMNQNEAIIYKEALLAQHAKQSRSSQRGAQAYLYYSETDSFN